MCCCQHPCYALLHAVLRCCCADDPDLTEWVKEPLPFLSDHLSGLPINCFRDPFILERPAADNGWRWRVMVGSNIDMAELAAAAAEPAPPVAAAAAAGGGSGEAGSRAPGAVQQQQQLSAAAQQEREQLKRAAAALQAAGWMGSNEGLSGGFTLGTATVYRSLTKELEGGEQGGRCKLYYSKRLIIQKMAC